MNTADTVRQVKIDVVDLKTKFKNAVSGLDEAARDITVTDINVLHDLTTLREPYESPGSPTSPQDGINGWSWLCGGECKAAGGYGESVDDDVIVGGSRSDAATNGINLRSGSGRVKTDAAGGEESSGLVRSATTTGRNIVAGVAEDDSWIEKRSRKEQGNDGWTLVKGRKRNLDYQRKVTTGVRGSKKSDGLSFKGVTRSIDVFIGRVDNDATEKDLTDYIKDVFKIEL
ncbi:hypothetical protein Pcinc_022322 [Petrolisthes cinctipes]|uniref:Uncharacterized protein n=1 Tax=Petrolisthes cinctipes TaxID=88211 RepID=A0AAE1KG50_PETCI|nr:hypothetical protein Pcinc_022322 [Petrolisthes cinctipes]